MVEELTVVGSVLLSGDEGLRVEERLVGSGPDLVNHVGLEIDLKPASSTASSSVSV